MQVFLVHMNNRLLGYVQHKLWFSDSVTKRQHPRDYRTSEKQGSVDSLDKVNFH